jgi:hypothetical protein
MDVIVNEDAPTNWNEMLQRSENAHIYNTLNYANVMQSAFGHKPLFFQTKNAQLLGFEQELKGIAGKLGRGFVAFAPPVGNENEFPDLLNAIEDECKKRKIVSITLWGSTLWNKQEAFGGFEKVEMQNVVAKLGKSEEELFATLAKAARKNLNKVKEIPGTVSEGTEKDLEDYYLNYKAHHDAIGLEVYPKEFFELLYKEIISNDLGKFFILRDTDGVFAGGLMVGTFGKSIYELSISSNWEKRELFPNDVIKWHTIKWANKNGFAQFDLSNIAVDADEGSKQHGVNRFKKKFGSVVSYNAYKKKLGAAKLLSKLKK